jgi:hypothetical protein
MLIGFMDSIDKLCQDEKYIADTISGVSFLSLSDVHPHLMKEQLCSNLEWI